MRFLSFSYNGFETAGLRIGDSVVKLSFTLMDLIQSGGLVAAGRAAEATSPQLQIPLSSVQYLPLLPNPPKVVNLIRSSGQEPPTFPGTSLSVPTRLCGHLDPMQIPRPLATLDYGVELAVVLGKGGRYITEAEAADHIVGYSVFNGGVVRGVPAGQTVAIARNGDRTAAFGPELVTPDEVPALAKGLTVTLKRNGETVQSGTTTMMWNAAQAIARISRLMTLECGDVLTMGTLYGTALDRQSDYLQAGEVVEAEIERIGVLRNVVTNEPIQRSDRAWI